MKTIYLESLCDWITLAIQIIWIIQSADCRVDCPTVLEYFLMFALAPRSPLPVIHTSGGLTICEALGTDCGADL